MQFSFCGMPIACQAAALFFHCECLSHTTPSPKPHTPDRTIQSPPPHKPRRQAGSASTNSAKTTRNVANFGRSFLQRCFSGIRQIAQFCVVQPPSIHRATNSSTKLYESNTITTTTIVAINLVGKESRRIYNYHLSLGDAYIIHGIRLEVQQGGRCEWLCRGGVDICCSLRRHHSYSNG